MPEPQQDKGAFLVFLLVFFGGLFYYSACDTQDAPTSADSPAPTQTATPAPRAKFKARILEYNAVNPATLYVRFQVTNVSDVPGKPDCTVDVSDPSHTYTGWEIFTARKRLAPGATNTGAGPITVKKEGAAWVSQAKVRCSDARP